MKSVIFFSLMNRLEMKKTLGSNLFCGNVDYYSLRMFYSVLSYEAMNSKYIFQSVTQDLMVTDSY